ncbi:MAG: alpha/beta hydrolase [Anaerolineales bacterium]|nr:alpha/beta hydrolase [Anaerolineales bacterium]
MKYFQCNNNGAPLHFLHANGYPPEVYKNLFELLQNQYHLFGMKLRPLWDDAKIEDVKNWQIFSDDLHRFLTDFTTDSAIGVGHSIGATVTLRAALQNPNKFRALVLLDPVLFVPSFIFMWKIIYGLGLGKRLHPRVTSALKRRKTFDNLDTLFQGYRTREVFKYMNDESLKIYIEGITKQKPDGTYELVFSPEWESHIYLTGLQDFDIWNNLHKLEIPTLIIRGNESDTFLENAEKLIKKKSPEIRFEVLEKATHIFPLEYPQEVFEKINKFIVSF